MVPSGKDPAPLGQKPLVTRGEYEGGHFPGCKPAQLEALLAPAELRVFGSDEHPAYIEVFVCRFDALRGDGVDVEVEGSG